MAETPDQEWRRLTKLYSEMYDGQLLELAASLNDLTQMGKTVLRDELRKRDLGDPLAPGWLAQQRMQEHEHEALEAAEADAANKPIEYTWKVPLCECGLSIEARQIAATLRRAGIQCWMNGPQFASDLRGPIILVAADQLDEARAIIANPIPQDIIDESRVEIPEYAPPMCPSCGAADPVLLSADPTNSWECEACGTEWSDPIDDRAEA
jgi:hypothetical protein